MRRFHIGIIGGIVVLLVTPLYATAQTGPHRSIFAEATGSTPPGESDSETLQNGDFRIDASKDGPPAGDGVDEDTFWDLSDWKWSHDSSPFNEPFTSISRLDSAKLTLGLDTRGGQVYTDWVEIHDDPFNNLEEVQDLPGNSTIEFVIDLLDYPGEGYTTDNLISYLDQNSGRLPFKYSDDAIVFYAKLELFFERLCEVAEWNNDTGGAFDIDANWLELEAPGADTTARFDYGRTYSVTFPQDVTNNSLEVAGDVLLNLDLSGNSYRLSNDCSAGTSISVSGDATELTIDGGDGGTVDTRRRVSVIGGVNPVLRLIQNAYLRVGAIGGGPADLLVQSTGGIAEVEVTQNSFFDVSGRSDFGRDDNTEAELWVDGQGSDYLSHLMYLGDDGLGSVRVTAGGTVTADTLVLGEGDDGVGRVSLNGAGSTLEADYLKLGDDGEGSMTVEQGASLKVTGRVIMADDGGSDGYLEVDGAGSKADTGPMIVGGDGDGLLIVENAGYVYVRGRLTVNGDESETLIARGVDTILDADEIAISVDGSAHVSIWDHAVVLSDLVQIGVRDEADVRVLDGSELSVTDQIQVGVQGNGSLLLAAGEGGGNPSSVEGIGQDVALIRLGVESTGSGTMQVAQRSTVDVKDLSVGVRGSGDLLVTQGGLVRAESVFIPATAEGSGAVLVDNAGIVARDVIWLGPLGSSGSLRVTDGGVVRTRSLMAGPNSTVSGSGRIIIQPQSVPKTLSPAGDIDTTGIFTDALFVSAGANIPVDSVVLGSGGILGGTFTWPSHLSNVGTISPGDSVGTSGTFTVDSTFTQTSAGELEIELGGSGEGEYDRLVVREGISLAGKLRVSRIGDYRPPVGTTYEIISAASIAGTFEIVDVTEFRADVVYGPTSVTLVVTSGVSVEGPDEDLPTEFALSQNYPNPFNPTTTISYALPQAADVALTVVDLLGRVVREVASGTQPAGTYEVDFDATGLPSGVYFYRLQAGDYLETRRMVVVR